MARRSSLISDLQPIYYYDASAKNRLLKVIDQTNNISGFDDDGTGTLASDPSNDYSYDAFGNMTKDENKAITAITYNHLNLPLKITFSNGYTIHYIYDALGTKMKKTLTQGSTTNTTEYLGDFQYLNGTLQFIQHAEGYVKYTAGGSSGFYNYMYHIKDHLGNIRVSFTKQLTNNSVKLLKENHYYPFGLKHSYNSAEFDYYYNTATSSLAILPITNSNRYQYNSKEWQNELSLNLYDYGARMFDPAIGRWGVVDPLAEKFYSWSPYNYVYNNPLMFIDPDGKAGMGAEWYPDPKDNSRLIAEEGDNAKTLSKDYGYTLKEARAILAQNNLKYENYVQVDPEVKEGQKLLIKNNLTESIKNNDPWYLSDNNCHGCAYSGSQGNKVEGMISGGEMDEILLSKYKPVSESEFIPRKSIGRFGGYGDTPENQYVENVNTHSVVPYGRSKDGTLYVYHKPGRGRAEITKFSNITNYGTMQGAPRNPTSTKNRNPVSSHSGWYNPKLRM